MVWPKNRAGKLPGQSHLISCCITVIVLSVGTVELQNIYIQQGGLGSATLAGAGAGQCLALAHISGLRWRQRQKMGRARAGWPGADRPVQTACTSCRGRPCPNPHPGPACSLLVHKHCPHVPSTLGPQTAVHTVPFEALTAPGNLLQGKIKNQT